MDGIDFVALIKGGELVGFPIQVGVFADDDPIAFFSLSIVTPVIDNLAYPNAAFMVDVHVGKAEDIWFCRKQLGIQSFSNVESSQSLVGTSIN